MPPTPPSDHKKTIIILLVVAAVTVLGFWYYKFHPFWPARTPTVSGPSMPAPLPEPKDLRFIQGELTQIVGKTMMVKVNKLVGQNFSSSRIISEEYKVVVGDKTELLKLASSSGSVKPAKITLKDFKKGNAVVAYSDRNLVAFKEFTAVKVELLPR